MATFFPTHTGAFRKIDAHPFRHLTMSVVEMALLTGVVMRVYRALVLSRVDGGGWLALALAFAGGVALLLGMVTLHLGNFTIRTWLWRAPAFALLEAAAESATSALLIVLQREPLGTARATFQDWPSLVLSTFTWRTTGILLFAAVLAAVVQLSRVLLLRHQHRTHTLEAVHERADR